MRILAVTPYYPPEGGGLERYAHETLRRLAQNGHAVRAMANTRQNLGDELADGLHITRRRAPMHLGNAPIDLGAARDIRLAIQSWCPDVVVAHAPVPFPADMACIAARKEGVPFVLTYHSGRLRGSTPALDAMASIARATIEKRLLGGSRRMIAVSPFVRDNALAAHRDRVAIVPPGVDAARFTPPARGRPADGPILFLGPLDSSYRWKGVDVLWDAFQLLRQDHPEARLRLVGSGNRFEEFTRKADAGIEVTPRLPEIELVDAYRRASVVVLPSVTDAEAFGMVLAEANACGTPVVGSRIGGIPDFIQHGHNGLLAEPGDATDLARKLAVLLDDRRLARRLGQNGRQKVLRDHCWDDAATATQAVLERALVG